MADSDRPGRARSAGTGKPRLDVASAPRIEQASMPDSRQCWAPRAPEPELLGLPEGLRDIPDELTHQVEALQPPSVTLLFLSLLPTAPQEPAGHFSPTHPRPRGSNSTAALWALVRCDPSGGHTPPTYLRYFYPAPKNQFPPFVGDTCGERRFQRVETWKMDTGSVRSGRKSRAGGKGTLPSSVYFRVVCARNVNSSLFLCKSQCVLQQAQVTERDLQHRPALGTCGSLHRPGVHCARRGRAPEAGSV